MSRLPRILILVLAVSCSPAQQRTARTVLDAALTAKEIACVFRSTLTSVPELGRACEIADERLPLLTPVLRNLIGVRAAGASAGARWESLEEDGGSPDGGR